MGVCAVPVPDPALSQETCTFGVPFVVMALVGVAVVIKIHAKRYKPINARHTLIFLVQH